MAEPAGSQFSTEGMKRMIAESVKEPAKAKWTEPIIFSYKRDWSPRLYVDYHKPNAVIICDSYDLRFMDKCIDSSGEVAVFSTLDAISEYWQYRIDNRNRHKTAYASRRGLFKFSRMPFKLKTILEIFQKSIEIILSSILSQSSLVCLHGIFVFPKSPVDRIE